MMKTLIYRYIRLGLALALSYGAMQAQATLTLDEARALALGQGHTMAMAREQERGAQLTLEAMRTNYLPKLSLMGLAYYAVPSKERSLDLGTYQLPPELLGRLAPLAQQMPQLGALLAPLAGGIQLPSIPYRINTNGSYYASLALTQPLYMGGKIKAGVTMARLGVLMSRAMTSKARTETILEVDEAYYQTLHLQALRALAEEYVSTLKQVHKDVDNAVRAGMRTRADLLRVEVELQGASLQLTKAQHGERLSRLNLGRLLKLDSLPQQLIAPTTEEADSPELFSLGDLSKRPEVDLLGRQVDLRKAEVKLARSEGLPQLGLRASYSYVDGLRVNDRKLLGNFTPSVLLSLNIPLWSWGETTSKVRKARTAQRIAEIQELQMREQMLLEQKRDESQYLEAHEALKQSLASVKLSEELLRQTKNRYTAGLDTTVDYLQAQTGLLKAQTELLKARLDLALSRTKLLKALGKL